jgi:hypothetical protein
VHQLLYAVCEGRLPPLFFVIIFACYSNMVSHSVVDPDPGQVGSGRLGPDPDPDPGLNK